MDAASANEPLAGGEVNRRQCSFCGGPVRLMVLLAVFLCRLEVSVLTLVIPLIAKEFHISTEYTAWVVFLPEFVGNMFAPSVGKFSDMYGHAGTWRSGLLMVTVSTWLSAWSPSMLLLLAARALTGFANCSVFAPALPLLAKGMNAERRGVMQSYISAVDALGSSVGVLVGGMVIDYVSWRWIFLAPAPFLTLVWLGSWWLVPPEPKAEASAIRSGGRNPLCEFDWLGTGLFASTSFCALLGLNRGNDSGWGSPLVIGLFVAAATQAPLLALVEARSRHPVLPIWLFFTRARVLFTLSSSLTWSCYGSCFLLVPLYMQDALGMHPGAIGDLLTIRPIAATIMAAAMSRVISRKALPMRRLAVIGALIQLCAYSTLNVATLLPLGFPFIALLELQLVLQAVGAFGTALPTNSMFVADLPEQELANSSAMRGVIVGIFSLFVKACNLSIIRLVGGERVPGSYHITWLVLLLLQVVALVSTVLVPASAELGARQTQVQQGRTEALPMANSEQLLDKDAEAVSGLRPQLLARSQELRTRHQLTTDDGTIEDGFTALPDSVSSVPKDADPSRVRDKV